MFKLCLVLSLIVVGCAGPTGPRGPTGIAGPTGPAGVCVVEPSPISNGVDVTCPDGTQVHLSDGESFVCPAIEEDDDNGKGNDEDKQQQND